jgi:hypothetical protein
MLKVNNNKVGLILGAIVAALNLIWSGLVWAGLAHRFLNWLFALGFIINPFQITEFAAGRMVVIVLVGFVSGYLIGWLAVAAWNKISGSSITTNLN